MTRIVAGAAGGRRLAVPPGVGTRPTSDRAREGLFSTVASLLGPLDGTRWLDLYAGSGAVGLEALSRGAAAAVLVEADPRAARTARANAAAVGLAGAEVVLARVERLVAGPPPGPAFDVVVADPPYAVDAPQVRGVLSALLAGGWLVEGALVVVERSSREPEWPWPEGLEPARSRRYGEAVLRYARAVLPDPAGGAVP